MPFNGSGVFVRLYSWVNDAAANIKIRADRMDNEMNGMATALSSCITKDGQTTVTANLPMAGYRHTSVGDATARNQYASYAQFADGKGLPTVGGTVDAVTLSYSIPHTTYVNGMSISWIQSGSNTGAMTINIDGLGAKSLTKNGTTAMSAGDIGAGFLVKAEYDGTRFQIQQIFSLADNSITNAKLANMAANTVKVNATGSSANPTDLALTANTFPARASTGNIVATPVTDFALTLLDDANAAAALATLGTSIITPWVAYTPATFQGLGTATGVSFFSRRVGGNLEIRGKFTAGTTTASEMRVSFGFNGTDANVTSSSTALASGVNIAGTFGISANVAAGLHALIEQSVSYLTFSSQTGSSNSLTKLNGNAFASSTQFSIMASVPISGWS